MDAEKPFPQLSCTFASGPFAQDTRKCRDAKKAAKILQVTDVKFYDFPDNQMDSVTLLNVVKAIEKEIEIVKPERIYTNHYGDLNVDHKTVANATITACRPHSGQVKEILSFEVLSSTEWSIPYSFKPNYFCKRICFVCFFQTAR